MNHWKRITVRKDTPLETAIATLEEGGQRIVLVVDDDERLQGTLTDGDVRRALLRRLPMTAPVGEVMCATPQVAELDWSREKILSVMEAAVYFNYRWSIERDASLVWKHCTNCSTRSASTTRSS